MVWPDGKSTSVEASSREEHGASGNIPNQDDKDRRQAKLGKTCFVESDLCSPCLYVLEL